MAVNMGCTSLALFRSLPFVTLQHGPVAVNLHAKYFQYL